MEEHTEDGNTRTQRTGENSDEVEEDIGVEQEYDEDEVKQCPPTTQDGRKSRETAQQKYPETFEEKQRQLLLADCYRLKRKMTKAKNSIQAPPLKPFTPYLFNSLEPYYNQYLVNYTVNELQEENGERPKTDYGQRSTSLGVVDPQVSWKMDNVPGPFSPSRLSGNLSLPKRWAANVSGKDHTKGSTRLPPFPKPSFPKINTPEYQPSKMDYSKLLKFRAEMDQEIEKLNKRKIKLDYQRTLKDWERMNLTELKELPPYSRYHVSKAVKTYFGTSKGAVRAINSLSKQLEVDEV